MLRTWLKVGAGVFALGIVAILIIANSVKADDGLNWIRKYGGKEEIRPGSHAAAGTVIVYPTGNKLRTHLFQFTSIPPALIREIYGRSVKDNDFMGYVNGTMPNGGIISYNVKSGHLVVVDSWQPTWIQKQWTALKEQLGYREHRVTPN